MILQTLPVLVTISWLPVATMGPAAAGGSCCAPKQPVKQSAPAAQASATITCPVTGEQIPAGCCPVKDEAEAE